MKASDLRLGHHPRPLAALASGLAAAGVLLAAASCSYITPLGPARNPAPTPFPAGVSVYKLGSPIVLQVMHSEPPTATGGCPTGWLAVFLPPGAAPMPCYRPAGTPVTITAAAVSPVFTSQPTPPPGRPAQTASDGIMVGVPADQVAAVTALITQAYNSRGALGVSVAGKLWQAAQVIQPFSGHQFLIALLSRSQALRLHRLLVPFG